MAITNLHEICRLCLETTDQLYNLESDFCILVMESGASVTIADALKYLDMNLKIPMEKEKPETEDENEVEAAENTESNILESDDDPSLPKSLCQDCLEKLQSAYEFKFRCEENKIFLKNYLKECADSKLAAERAAKEAALMALDLDIDNLDNLPDKLVLKEVKKEKRTRRPRDPSKPKTVPRKRRIADKNVIIADDSQIETVAYVRKLITTPEQSPDQKGHSSKRKSKHVIIEDVVVGEKPGKKSVEVKHKEEEIEEEPKQKIKEKKPERAIDEPIFEDDEDFEHEPPKKTKRTKK